MKPKHKMTVLHFSIDYSDEFELEFIKWVDKAWWKQYTTDLIDNEDSIFPTDCYFGENECISFRSADDILDCIEEHLADEDEIKFLQRLSNGRDSIGPAFELPEID